MLIEKVIQNMFNNYNWKLKEVDSFNPPYYDRKLALYIHVPFCTSLCPFCIFHSILYKPSLKKGYFDALKKELEKYISMGFNFSTIYIGGGTPTLATEEVCDLLDYIKEYNKIDDISIEASPYDINDEKVSELEKTGITRLSLGVESFVPVIQRKIGRQQVNTEELLEKIDIASKIPTLNVDILFNIPGQKKEDLVNEIDIVKKSKANQITFYPIMPSIRQAPKEFMYPDEKNEKMLYNVLTNQFSDSDYYQSTAWTFSKNQGSIVDEYIIDNDDFIGVGTGAMSHLSQYYYANSFSLEKYEKMINNGKFSISLLRELNLKDQIYIYLIYRLYSLKINKKEFETKFNHDIYHYLRSEINLLSFLGIIKDDGNYFKVTNNGKYYSNLFMKYLYINISNIRKYAIQNKI
ncbi:MAG: radical SAM protein [Caldisphaera sp.]